MAALIRSRPGKAIGPAKPAPPLRKGATTGSASDGLKKG